MSPAWLQALPWWARLRRARAGVLAAAPPARGSAAAAVADPAALRFLGDAPQLEASLRRWRRIFVYEVLAVTVACLGLRAYQEVDTSRAQALRFSALGRDLSYALGSAGSARIHFPKDGPYDRRLGYSRIPRFREALERSGFRIREQARWSEALEAAVASGLLFPVYPEKTVAGLELVDRQGRLLHSSPYPQRSYPGLSAIPPLVVDSLLFIENRELLDTDRPYLNPAVEWDRFARAALSLGWSRLGGDAERAGGSTLATQLEKLRHSPDGRTSEPREKLKQMLTAAVRAYRDGPENLGARRRIVLDYINSIPLAAIEGRGEVQGLGDGLEAWFGMEFDRTNRLLADAGADLPARALAYRAALALLLAQRRPTHDLVRDRRSLDRRTERYLALLRDRGVIPADLAAAALAARPILRDRIADDELPERRSDKTALGLRAELQSLLELDNPYDLERLDLVAKASIDRDAQERVSTSLRRIQTADGLAAAGLAGPRMLESGDPASVSYSFTLYERGTDVNYLRVRTDTLDRPLDLNAGSKLELGSTAKLRTLVTYLECVDELHGRMSGLAREQLALLPIDPRDRLGSWARGHLLGAADPGLDAMLRAALRRVYSASSAESFFTGGGLHRFSNFEDEHEGESLTVAEGLRESVNLVFIRLLRDVVSYHTHGAGATEPAGDPVDPERRQFLEESADRESRAFLERFQRAYAPLSPEAAAERLLGRVQPRAAPLAAVYLYLEPQADQAGLERLLRARVPRIHLPPRELERLMKTYAGDRLTLSDRGYVADLHPLEIWTAAYLRNHARATAEQLRKESRAAREETYRWLFEARHASAQRIRIQQLREERAFQAIHRRWQRLGYPFPSLVPSLATAIGSSADRPAALAELVGILLDDGVRKPIVVIESLRFAAGTPFETRFAPGEQAGEQVLKPEIARVALAALLDVVEAGTARRLGGGLLLPDGSRVAVGGKTGTGDNRREAYSESGRLLGSQAMSRTATFAFYLGDRFFGVLTAFVPGAQADSFSFTSSLPVQVLEHLAPDLAPLLQGRQPAAPIVLRQAAGKLHASHRIDVVAAVPPRAPAEPAPVEADVVAAVPPPAVAEPWVAPVEMQAAPAQAALLGGDEEPGTPEEMVHALDVLDGLAPPGDAAGAQHAGGPGVVGGEGEREITVEPVEQLP